MNKTIKLLAIIAAIVVSENVLNAQDRLFTYTYQSGVLNKGQREIEVWNTFRTGKPDYFARLDNRTEFEIGLGKNLQTAFYLNLTSKTETIDLSGIKTPDTRQEMSFSNEWKYKILDPVADPVGLALYGEYGIAGNEFELEGKLIVDKRLGDFTLAANAVYEAELEPEYAGSEFELEAEEHKALLNFSAAYSFRPSFSLTMESSFQNIIQESELKHSALFAGLGLSYVQQNFFLNLTVMPQITSFRGATNGHLNFDEFEKVQTRLLISYAF